MEAKESNSPFFVDGAASAFLKRPAPIDTPRPRDWAQPQVSEPLVGTCWQCVVQVGCTPPPPCARKCHCHVAFGASNSTLKQYLGKGSSPGGIHTGDRLTPSASGYQLSYCAVYVVAVVFAIVTGARRKQKTTLHAPESTSAPPFSFYYNLTFSRAIASSVGMISISSALEHTFVFG